MAKLPPSLRIFAIFSVFLFVLVGMDGINRDYPNKGFIKEAVGHLLVVVTAVVVGAVLLWIVEEATKAHLAPAIREGLATLARDVKEEVGKFPKSWQGITEVIARQLNFVQDEEARQLAREGKIKEAAAKVEARPADEIAILLQSTKPEDWKRAADLWAKAGRRPPQDGLSLAFLYWRAGQIGEAIRIAEAALSACTAKDGDALWKLQNSLAYYYAETGDHIHEQKAREYVAAARAAVPERSEPIDTEAYVKISFASTREEVRAGIAIAQRAYQLGVPVESFTKNVAKANEMLQRLS
ncbi:MAG TPA: hypothetical protein VMB85_23530 [Bryobacteraceae bacterium]|jgi:hypothetical protein|nr:hypothetical protein [Bryobacteraceae bacterium]